MQGYGAKAAERAAQSAAQARLRAASLAAAAARLQKGQDDSAQALTSGPAKEEAEAVIAAVQQSTTKPRNPLHFDTIGGGRKNV